MKHLLLLRHAKSSWADPSLSDFDRPLNARGLKAASKMSRFLSEKMELPDVILCSTAMRTRQTLKPLLDVYAHSFEIKLSRELYHASDMSMLDMIQNVEGKADVVMVIGHNPGMEQLADYVCGKGGEDDLYEMSLKFPTAACAHLSFDVDNWSKIGRASGVLKRFFKPRDL
ncbi:Phosphohistidine phosphatase [Candidatus Terasakiella magnetica]|uniref:Phosphohistidine phosphatase n=1 Tax=Candidatus Terasakiella magnetica TaxID=1867952 RepID=A0A1C3RDM5_9PROT|nr:histidine phosphatase family protein [Candidatus Terasakiella magnetica]SCA55348.1 Phosphohistidine phosphatase [Candidatus Terasakiella magnetica]